MGQRSEKSAHYNKGIWKKRNARYYDQKPARGPSGPTQRSTRKPSKARRGPSDADYQAARLPGKFCTPTCGCHHHMHRGQTERARQDRGNTIT